MTINKENIDTVIRMMKIDETMRFRMQCYVCEVNEKNSRDGWCGTNACIAGYASVAVNGAVEAIEIEDNGGDTVGIAREFLGITEDQASLLFVPSLTLLNMITRDEAITVLEHLRDTGEVDWTIVGYDPRYKEENWIKRFD